MILTNTQMFDSVQALQQASSETGLLGYAVAVNLRKLSTTPELVEFFRRRDELLAEHGTPAGEGRYNLTPDAAAAFQAALQPYAELTADVAAMQVEPAVFYGGGLTSGQMYTLSWMAKEG